MTIRVLIIKLCCILLKKTAILTTQHLIKLKNCAL
jgi:hypothetical protein